MLAQSRQIDLLLTDVMMPGISGPELADQLVSRRKDLTLLYMSGYDRNLIAGKVAAGANFLAKPFTFPALLSKVSDLLG